MKTLELEPYDEVNAASVAHIVGASSATAKALALLKEKRAAGETVGLFLDHQSRTVVVATMFLMDEDDAK